VKHKLYRQISAVILIIVLLMEAGMLSFFYVSIYHETTDNSKKSIQYAANLASLTFSMCDPNVSADYTGCDEQFTAMCDVLDVDYIYSIKPHVTSRDEVYLSVGMGKDAPQNLRELRPPGYVSKGTLTDQQIQAFQGKGEGVSVHEVNEFGDTLIYYLPVTSYYDTAQQKTVDETVSLVCVEISITTIMNEFRSKFLTLLLITAFLTLTLMALFALMLYFRVSKPLSIISKRMKSFVSEREDTFEKLPVKGQDELAEVSESFNIMAEEIDSYLTEIEKLNRQKAEMSVAQKIQLGLLEPPHFENGTVVIDACMLPAKDVGGDLYDYCTLPDGSYCVLIADVSGKGVSAALLMSRAITMLRQFAEEGLSPGEILRKYNNCLAEHNPNVLFITTFVAIIRPQDGTLTYANAGHNPPYLLSESLIKLDGEFGAAAGIFHDADYPEHTVRLRAGDLLLLYTDGVTEAESADGDFFGEERLEELLRANRGENSETVLTRVLEEIKLFTNGAVQNDDITMLGMQTVMPETITLHLQAETQELTKINEVIKRLGADADSSVQLQLIAEEMFVNICSYAYKSGGTVDLTITKTSDEVKLVFADTGAPFDPTADIPDIENYDAKTQIGGLGRFLTFSVADAYDYQHTDGKNVLTIMKKTSRS